MDPLFEQEVAQAKENISLRIIAAMARNDMPECFEFTRVAGVALAQLLMEALRQNEELLKLVPKH